MGHADQAEALAIEVAYSPQPRVVDCVALQLPAGATVAQALVASGLLAAHGLVLEQLTVGVWCRKATLDAPLRHRDRVEIYRPLVVDPKEARRQRYQRRNKRKTPAAPGVAPPSTAL
jgi:uncharacterized protein